MQNGQLVAAVDLGSNSFRLEIARLEHGRMIRQDYLKDTVRQGAGLDEDRNLTLDAMERGWTTLARFGERLAGFKPQQVRAVATQTLREAKNRDIFVSEGERRLGFPIEVIPGREEARLIYQGVAHALGKPTERRLVLDIGGRSTELITGRGLSSEVMESYRIGSVAWAGKYFPQGELSASNFDKALVAAKAVLDEATARFHAPWDQVYGTAGTVGAIGTILQARLGTSHSAAAPIEREGLAWLKTQFLRAGHIDKLDLPELKEDRKPVLASGFVILQAIFDLFSLKNIHAIEAGLRHGVLYDLLNRDSVATDIRGESIARLAHRFDVDHAQIERVNQIAQAFFSHIESALSHSPEQAQRHRRKLGWAAQLHEIGTLISHSDSHKHSAYIIDNADVDGFSSNELHRLSLLVLGHKGKLSKLLKEETLFADSSFLQQLICLRLAVILCHARVSPPHEQVGEQVVLRCEPDKRRFLLTAPRPWASKFPQSMHLLEQEQQTWGKTSWSFEVAVR